MANDLALLGLNWLLSESLFRRRKGVRYALTRRSSPRRRTVLGLRGSLQLGPGRSCRGSRCDGSTLRRRGCAASMPPGPSGTDRREGRCTGHSRSRVRASSRARADGRGVAEASARADEEPSRRCRPAPRGRRSAIQCLRSRSVGMAGSFDPRSVAGSVSVTGSQGDAVGRMACSERLPCAGSQALVETRSRAGPPRRHLPPQPEIAWVSRTADRTIPGSRCAAAKCGTLVQAGQRRHRQHHPFLHASLDETSVGESPAYRRAAGSRVHVGAEHAAHLHRGSRSLRHPQVGDGVERWHPAGWSPLAKDRDRERLLLGDPRCRSPHG